MTTKHTSSCHPQSQVVLLTRSIGVCFVVLFSFSIRAQSVIYSQPFSGTLAGSGWTTTNLTSPWGNASLFGISNLWQVSDAESGLSANTCGAGGMGDQSLYMGASGLSSGAAYLSDVNTNRRVASPNINTTGYTTVILSFDYIGNGEGTTDKAYVVYSIDGGTSWISPTGAPTSASPAMGTGGSINNLKSQLCGAQGLWTHITWNMPVTCENITNLRVGFVWQSNNNSAGSDPSFAVDDVTITATINPTPIELLSFSARYDGHSKVALSWSTGTETNNDFFTLERSVNAVEYSSIYIVDGAGNSSSTIDYYETDDSPVKGLSYYRLKQTDFDGNYSYSPVVPVMISNDDLEIISVSGAAEQYQVSVAFSCSRNCRINMEIYDMTGKKITSSILDTEEGPGNLMIPIPELSPGVYLLKAFNGEKQTVKKFKL